MKARILLMCTIVLMFFVGLNADPISNEVFVGGGDYTTIQGAVDSIAANGIFNDINVIITNAYEPVNETFPITIGSDFNTSEFIVTFIVNDEITIECNEEAAMIVFDGCKNVVFDGGTDDENSRMLTFKNPKTSGNVFEFQNGAQNIVLRNLNILGATRVKDKGVIHFAGSEGEQGNNDNIIEYCNISTANKKHNSLSPHIFISSKGTDGKPNSFNQIRHNLISGFGAVTPTLYHLRAIYLQDKNNDWFIENNHIFQETKLNLNNDTYIYIIYIAGDNSNTTIGNNIIGGSEENNSDFFEISSSKFIDFRGIYVNCKTQSNSIISDNTIKNIKVDADVTMSAIRIESTNSDVNSNFSVYDNKIENINIVFLYKTNFIAIDIFKIQKATIKNNSISDIDFTLKDNTLALDFVGICLDSPSNTQNIVEIDSNRIFNIRGSRSISTTTFNSKIYGIYNSNQNVEIKNNIIADFNVLITIFMSTSQLYGIYQNQDNSESNNSLVYNNMISLKMGNNNLVYGIYDKNTNGNYFFNTVHLFNDVPNDHASYCYYSENTFNNKEKVLKNNIFSNAVAGDGNHYAVYINDNYQNYELDYNIYNAQDLGYINGGGDLDNVLGLGEDGHSKILAVDFLSDTDLHLNLASVNDGYFGIPIEGIETDIDGDVRNPDNPIIGADEVIYSPTLPVTLSAFYADASSTNNVLLKWVAETETSLLGYKVLRSADNSVVNARYVSSLIPAKNQSTQVEYSFTDNDLYNQRYYYWLEINELNATCEYYGPIAVDVHFYDVVPPIVESVTELYPAYPNPANPSTTISFSLALDSMTEINVYNAKGQLVKRLLAENVKKGQHRVVWNGLDENGTPCATGIYYYRMQCDEYSVAKKLLMLK